MMITSLEKMEEIVAKNKSLFWDGWTVVNSFQSDKARTSKMGVYRKGRWYIQKRFEPGKNGWNIPDNFVR
jgi:hypothetical protein